MSQLWQLPLLLFSFGLFGFAAYLFIDPHGGQTLAERVEIARKLLGQDRPDAAREWLNKLLGEEKFPAEVEGAARIILGEALEKGQKQRKISIAENHRRIIEQTKAGLALGIAPDADVHRRLAESYEALGRLGDAVEHYRSAMAGSEASGLKWRRKLIELLLLREEYDGAEKELATYLTNKDLAQSERAWGLGERAHILVDRGSYRAARELLEEAMKLEGVDVADRGQFNYWLGYCAWKLGELPEAERYLRVARDQLQVQHPLDGEAAYALGKIRQVQHDYGGANAFFEAVLTSHLDGPAAPAAKLGRGVCRLALGEDEAGLYDLQTLVKRLKEKEKWPRRLKEETIEGLRQGSLILSGRGNYGGALEAMAYEQELETNPPPGFFSRMAKIYEKRAEQLEVGIADLSAAERQRREQQVRDIRMKAGDAHVAYSRGLTLEDDKEYGSALWRGIELYDAVGELSRSIAALETFVNERPDDALAPDALLRLGQSFHAAGLYDKAIGAYRHNQFRYPKSLAASKSGVPLARAYTAKGPDSYAKAEEVLKGVVENNPQVTPDAQEFREGLLELASLYYRTNRYEMAISRLEEFTQRYPGDERKGQMLFLMGDGYRKSAEALSGQLAATKAPATQPSIDLAEATRARTQRLTRARQLFDDVLDYYRANPAAKDLDKMYQKFSYFYRADCTFDLGNYAEAIKLYGDAAFRYQDDAAALGAYVQIVNANVALGNVEEAKAANERAKWMLRRMPKEAFVEGRLGMTREYWDRWLTWSGEAGMWE
jgi:tetratricopeptide (TPR) repeat protein